MGRRQRGGSLCAALVLAALLTQACGSQKTLLVATGHVRCGDVAGVVAFSPPLKETGDVSQEHVTVTAHLSGCAPTGSNVTAVSGGTVTLTITVRTNACAGLVQFPSSTGAVATPSSSLGLEASTTWSPTDIEPSTMSFSGFAVTTDDAGDAGFAFPGAGHRALVSGSFAGSDHGALSTASVFTDEQISQIAGGCSQISGLASIPLGSGEVTFG